MKNNDAGIFFVEILEYCEKTGDSYSELAIKALENQGKGESLTSSLGAAAYFFQQSDIYRHTIPNIIKNLYKEFKEATE